MKELALTSDTNPFLNGSRFDPSKVSQEPIPSGGKPPDISVFTDHRNKLTYDTQYIQIGWSITKTYGPGSAVMANNSYMAFGPFLAGTVMKWFKKEPADLSWFKADNVPANSRGIMLGEFGATHFQNFKDFVKNLCPEQETSCLTCPH